MNKKLITILLLLFILTVRTPIILALSKSEYYKVLFTKWGLHIDINEQNNNTGDSDTSALDNVATVGRPKNTLLILTSEGGGAVLPGYREVIVVCDTNQPIKVIDTIQCSSNTVNDLEVLDFYSDISQYLRPQKVGNTSYFILPEGLLYTPLYEKQLAKYFSSMAKSLGVGRAADVGIAPYIRNVLSELRNLKLVELTKYAAALMLVAFCFGVGKKLILNKARFLDKEFFVHRLSVLKKVLRKLIVILGAILFIQIALLFSLLVFLFSKNFRLNEFTNFLDFSNLQIGSLHGFLRLGIATYFYFIFLIAAFLCIVILILISEKFSVHLTNMKTNVSFVKWMFTITFIINCFLLLFFNNQAVNEFLYLGFAAMLWSALLLRKSGVSYPSLFNGGQKKFITIAALMTGILFITASVYMKMRGPNYSYEPLFGTSDTVITLPRVKTFKPNTFFYPFYYNGDVSTFVNGYLIYMSGKETLRNLPINEYSNTGDIMLVAKSTNNTIAWLLQNPKLVPLVSSDEFGGLVGADFTPTSYIDPSISIKVGINCDLKPEPAKIDMRIISINKALFGKAKLADLLKSDAVDLISFAGCSGPGIQYLDVPVDTNYFPASYSILEIDGIDPFYIKEFKIFSKNVELPANLLKSNILKDGVYKVLYADVSNREVINVYNVDLKSTLELNLVNTRDGFDISSSINELIQENRIKGPFTIWTDTEYGFMENKTWY